jgi:hypothetical protein
MKLVELLGPRPNLNLLPVRYYAAVGQFSGTKTTSIQYEQREKAVTMPSAELMDSTNRRSINADIVTDISSFSNSPICSCETILQNLIRWD